MLSGRALAFVLLAWSWFRVLARRAFTRSRPGIELFRQHYGAEGLLSLQPEEHAQLASFGGCIACGRCNRGEGARMAASNGAYPGLMQLVLASSRSLPDYDAASRGFAHVPEDALRRKVARCPARIPFAELAAFVHDRARQMQQDVEGRNLPAIKPTDT